MEYSNWLRLKEEEEAGKCVDVSLNTTEKKKKKKKRRRRRKDPQTEPKEPDPVVFHFLMLRRIEKQLLATETLIDDTSKYLTVMLR
ncbi:hypothetical protein OIU79_024254 [Salix purpurea]|uniref:Uncharacterized protein n=1 Tax=Salix purpurea TaxID=77065 RepID=A0A9Q0WBF3_SALPP|nr:hypothetical protein OIU79_024254 [Salix purpurea]